MLRRLASGAACALLLVLAAAPASHAQTRTVVDGPGDVWSLFTGPAPDEHTRVEDRRRGDVLRTVFRHTRDRVVIRTKFAKLDRKGGSFVVVARLRTDAGMVRWLALEAGPRTEAGTWRGDTILYRRDMETPVACATTSTIDYPADVAVMRVPRRCLDDPRWFRSAAQALFFTGRAVFADNPHNHGPGERMPRPTARIRPS